MVLKKKKVKLIPAKNPDPINLSKVQNAFHACAEKCKDLSPAEMQKVFKLLREFCSKE